MDTGLFPSFFLQYTIMKVPIFQKEYTISQYANRLGVSTRTVRRWIQDGKLAAKTDELGNYHVLAAESTHSKILHDDQTLLPSNQAAKMLGISKKTLRRWEHAGLITSRRTAGGARRYAHNDIQELVVGKTTYQRLPKTISKDIPIKPTLSPPPLLSPISPLFIFDIISHNM